MSQKDAINELGEAEVVELEDQDLDDVAGGRVFSQAEGTNDNCGCGGFDFSGERGADNNNCGCPATTF